MENWIQPYWWNDFVSFVAHSEFLNSNLVTAFVGSLVGAGAGAWAGAYAAQKIAEKTKLRDELQNQIRNSNAAISLSFFICSVCIALKEQHTVQIKSELDKNKERWEQREAQRMAGRLIGTFSLPVEFKTVTPITVPIETLEKLVFDKISLQHRPLALFGILAQTINSLNTLIIERTKIIEEFKASGHHSGRQLVEFYLGIPTATGVRDERYASSVQGLYRYADDCIFFSKQLAEDIYSYSQRQLEIYKAKFSSPYPQVDRQQLTTSKQKLVPDESEYASWMTLPN